MILCIVLFFICGCGNDKLPANKQRGITDSPGSQTIQYKGLDIRLNQLVECSYPEHDPVYPGKKDKKLLLMDISVSMNGNVTPEDKEFMVPASAILSDSRGNEYAASLKVIAMAQNNHCIRGDDIDAYNAIWNALLKSGEVKRAFLLGFELPAATIPAKLYWNKQWEQQEIFFALNDMPLMRK